MSGRWLKSLGRLLRPLLQRAAKDALEDAVDRLDARTIQCDVCGRTWDVRVPRRAQVAYCPCGNVVAL